MSKNSKVVRNFFPLGVFLPEFTENIANLIPPLLRR